ncbi:MAG: formimidoylglutamase [Flavobacteriales bacterium]
MSTFEFKFFDGQNKKLSFLQRQGETRMGAVLQESKLENAKFVLIGIEENAGPQANLGRPGSENAFNAFLRVCLNSQVHDGQTFEKVAYLGKITQKTAPLDQADAAEMVADLDALLYEVLSNHLSDGQIPIVVGGGHNNALPLIRWAARKSPISVLNIDAHADLRTTEKRHSGNSFSTAIAENHLRTYGVFGLHEAFNNQYIRQQLENPIVSSRFYEDYLQGPHQLLEDISNFIQHQRSPIGIEIDMDAIANMPSSAQSPSGWRLDDIRSLLYKIGHLKPQIAYLNLTEAAPQNESDDLIVGKALTYLFRDFIKAIQ